MGAPEVSRESFVVVGRLEWTEGQIQRSERALLDEMARDDDRIL